MTAHELARELLKMDDLPVEVEGWCRMSGFEMGVEPCEYNDGETVIIMQVPERKEQ